MKNILYILIVCTNMFLNAEIESNAITLSTYSHHVLEYIQGTPQEVSGMMKEWIDRVISKVNHKDVILELGSAFGRDAAYFREKGYTIECTDAVPEFVSLLQNSGFNARLCNALRDNFGYGYGLVFANAVFLHFTPEELALVLHKVHSCLIEDGILAFSVKVGEGFEWSNEKVGAPRYFHYWQDLQMQTLLESIGFVVDSVQQDGKWLLFIAKK